MTMIRGENRSAIKVFSIDVSPVVFMLLIEHLFVSAASRAYEVDRKGFEGCARGDIAIVIPLIWIVYPTAFATNPIISRFWHFSHLLLFELVLLCTAHWTYPIVRKFVPRLFLGIFVVYVTAYVAYIFSHRRLRLEIHISRFVIFFRMFATGAFSRRFGSLVHVSADRAFPFDRLFAFENGSVFYHFDQFGIAVAMMRLDLKDLSE